LQSRGSQKWCGKKKNVRVPTLLDKSVLGVLGVFCVHRTRHFKHNMKKLKVVFYGEQFSPSILGTVSYNNRRGVCASLCRPDWTEKAGTQLWTLSFESCVDETKTDTPRLWTCCVSSARTRQTHACISHVPCVCSHCLDPQEWSRKGLIVHGATADVTTVEGREALTKLVSLELCGPPWARLDGIDSFLAMRSFEFFFFCRDARPLRTLGNRARDTTKVTHLASELHPARFAPHRRCDRDEDTV